MNPISTAFSLVLIGCAAACLPAQAGPALAAERTTEPGASVPAAVATRPAARMTPYLFGSWGRAYDSVIHIAHNPGQGVAASDRQSGVQLGAGMQFNELLGVESFVQGGPRHEYRTVDGTRVTQAVRVFGARVTLGVNLTESLRFFGKAGLARVIHSGRGTWDVAGENQAYSNRQTRSLLGLGVTVRLTDSLSLRADADHVFPRRNDQNTGWGHLNHFGLGLQYSF
jgi:opacity protein-like surface antigen